MLLYFKKKGGGEKDFCILFQYCGFKYKQIIYVFDKIKLIKNLLLNLN